MFYFITQKLRVFFTFHFQIKSPHQINKVCHPALLSLLVFFVIVAPANTQPPPNNTELYQIQARHTAQPIVVDGRLDEAAWKQAQVATDFWLQRPVDDQKASRRTEVRLIYDHHHLYLSGQGGFTAEFPMVRGRKLLLVQ
jgi:hypothetical protein